MAKKPARRAKKKAVKKKRAKARKQPQPQHPHKSPVATRCYGKVIKFESIADAARAMGIEYPHTISNCCRGLVKTAGGLQWWYTSKRPLDDKAGQKTKTKQRQRSLIMSVPLYKISLNGDMFNDLKSKFDASLTRTLLEMQKKESEEATITLKLSIKLEQGDAPCDDDAECERTVTKPRFEHKIVSNIQYKFEDSGTVGGELEMYWDKDSGCYVTRKIGSPQTDLFDAAAAAAMGSGSVAPETDAEEPTVREVEAVVLEIEGGTGEVLEIEDRREGGGEEGEGE